MHPIPKEYTPVSVNKNVVCTHRIQIHSPSQNLCRWVFDDHLTITRLKPRAMDVFVSELIIRDLNFDIKPVL
jgi:hypothetical protein